MKKEVEDYEVAITFAQCGCEREARRILGRKREVNNMVEKMKAMMEKAKGYIWYFFVFLAGVIVGGFGMFLGG